MQAGVDFYKRGARGRRILNGSEELLPQAKGHIYDDWREGNGNNDNSHKMLHLGDHLRIKLGEACLKYFCHLYGVGSESMHPYYAHYDYNGYKFD